MTRRIAVIDIGTNTFNLLVVDKNESGFEKVFATKEGVGLGLGGINEGEIAEDAMQRGMDTLNRFMEKCRELNVERIKAFGTSMVRDASNKAVFIDQLNAIGLEIEVISGDREASLIHQGVKMGYPFHENALIMDIGGGSTEFIYASKLEVIKSHSFDIGTARIYQMFEFSDPYTDEQIQQVIQFLENETKGYFDDIQTTILIGASGSFETFYAVLHHKEYPENEFEDMNGTAVLAVLDEMIKSTMEERMANEFIIPIRKKMAPIAAIKIKWIMEKLNIQTLTISPFAMKEGVITEL